MTAGQRRREGGGRTRTARDRHQPRCGRSTRPRQPAGAPAPLRPVVAGGADGAHGPEPQCDREPAGRAGGLGCRACVGRGPAAPGQVSDVLEGRAGGRDPGARARLRGAGRGHHRGAGRPWWSHRRPRGCSDSGISHRGGGRGADGRPQCSLGGKGSVPVAAAAEAAGRPTWAPRLSQLRSALRNRVATPS
jgi:hypothetical protein